MTNRNEKLPNPKEIEKEIGEFLTKKFGANVKLVSPLAIPKTAESETDSGKKKVHAQKSDFDLKPMDLIAYLDQYLIKQDDAKAVLSTKICTHFNRVKQAESASSPAKKMVGSVKNNVLMLGPTGVGKTYIIKLIADKIGVPFVKGDATKFSETGYVGGDVEDLVRDLVREAGDDIERAQCGIIYIDEIDKIASSKNLIGADVSRTGVQRALLKPMEETEVDLKVSHDPISMMQEIEHFRKTGTRDKRTVNTANILFIMSGAFGDLTQIIQKRLTTQPIGFGAQIASADKQCDLLKQVTSEDLTAYGFESEFVGRLPVRAVFENLTEDDLFEILKNPNNPIVLGKKLDFAAYGIRVKFSDRALRMLAKEAYAENTGARGLVSAVERALLLFEKTLPSSDVTLFPVGGEELEAPRESLGRLLDPARRQELRASFERLVDSEKGFIRSYLSDNQQNLTRKHKLNLTQARMDLVADCYAAHIMDLGQIIEQIKSSYDEVKKIELYFFKNHDINIVLEEDAVDDLIARFDFLKEGSEDLCQRLSSDFEHGLKLVHEKTGRTRFFITKKALADPEGYIAELIKSDRRQVLPR